MENKLISVIVPVYNVEKYLERCVESIIAQTYKNLEIILVDDGSTDSSGSLCDELAKRDERIRVIHTKNGGLSSARNAGIDIAQGEYLGFIDSDDWTEPDMYSVLCDSIEKHSASIACGGRYDIDGETGERTVGLCPEKDEVLGAEESLARLLVWDGMDSSAADKLFRKDIFRKKRFPEGKLSEDVAIMYRLIDDANGMALVSKPLYNYFHRRSSISTASFSERKLDSLDHSREILDFIKKNYPAVIDSAKYFRSVQVQYIYRLIVESGAYKESRRRRLIDELASELKAERKIYYSTFPKTFRARLSAHLMLHPSLYIFMKERIH